MWKNPQATVHFERQRRKADNSKTKYSKALLVTTCHIGDEIDAKSGGTLTLPRSNARVLDLCMAPGGFTASVLKYSPHAVVCAFTLHPEMGGHERKFHKHTSVDIRYGDITMLHKEFGVEGIPHDHCELSKFDSRRLWLGKGYDLIFCDGQVLRTHEIADYRRQVETTRLRISQLILAMQRIESGGTLIMSLHHSAAYEAIKILHLFDNIADLQLFKSTSSHMKKASFYLIAKNVQSDRGEAVAAVNEWKRLWKELTFPTLDENGQAKPPKVANESERAGQVSDLLETFGERIIELGEPLWQIQKEALATARWPKKKEKDPGSEGIRTGEASTTATDNAAAAVQDSGEDAGETGDEEDDVDAAPVLGDNTEPTASDSAELAEVSVAVGRMDVDD